MIKIHNKLQNYLKNDNISLIPIVVIGKPKEWNDSDFRGFEDNAIFLSTKQINLKVPDIAGLNDYEISTIPLLNNFPNITDGIDYFNRRSSVSSFELEIENRNFPTPQSKSISDRFNDLQNHIVNNEVRVYYVAPISTTIMPEIKYEFTDESGILGHSYYAYEDSCDSILAFRGSVRGMRSSLKFMTLDIEDRTSLISKEVPESNKLFTSQHPVTEKDYGKPVPMQYGHIDRAPIVYASMPLSIDYGTGTSNADHQNNPRWYVDERPIKQFNEQFESAGSAGLDHQIQTKGMFIYDDGDYLCIDKVSKTNKLPNVSSSPNYDITFDNNIIFIHTHKGNAAQSGKLTTTLVRYPTGASLEYKNADKAYVKLYSYNHTTGEKEQFFKDGQWVNNSDTNPNLFGEIWDTNLDSSVYMTASIEEGEEREAWIKLFFDPISANLPSITYYRSLVTTDSDNNKCHWDYKIGGSRYREVFGDASFEEYNTNPNSYPPQFLSGITNGEEQQWLQVGFPEEAYTETELPHYDSTEENPNKNRGWDKLNSFDYVKFGFPSQSKDMATIGGGEWNDLRIWLREFELFQYGVITDFGKHKWFADIIGRVGGGHLLEGIGSFGGACYSGDQSAGISLMGHNQVIDNPTLVLLDILISELGFTDFDRFGMRYSLWTQFDEGNMLNYPKVAFSVNEQINSMDLFNNILLSTNLIGKMRNDGRFSFIPLKYAYNPASDPYIQILERDVIDFRAEMTPREDIISKCYVKYKFDYGSGNFGETTTAITANEMFDGYTPEYFSLDANHEESTVTIESKYIRDHETAYRLRDFILCNYCNARLSISITLPLNYIQLEVGDLISLDKHIQGKKLFGENYDMENYDVTDSYTRNGQPYYPFFMITDIQKNKNGIQITALQMIHTGLSGEVVWGDENEWGETVIYGCTDLPANNFNPAASQDDGSCDYSGNQSQPDLQITAHQFPFINLFGGPSSISPSESIDTFYYYGGAEQVSFGNWSVDSSDISYISSIFPDLQGQIPPPNGWDGYTRWYWIMQTLGDLLNGLNVPASFTNFQMRTGRMHFEWLVSRESITDVDGQTHSVGTPNGWDNSESQNYLNMANDPFKTPVKFSETTNILANTNNTIYQSEFPFATYQNIEAPHEGGQYSFFYNNADWGHSGHAGKFLPQANYHMNFGLDIRDYSWNAPNHNNYPSLHEWAINNPNQSGINFQYWYHNDIYRFNNTAVTNHHPVEYDVSGMTRSGHISMYAPKPGEAFNLHIHLKAYYRDFEEQNSMYMGTTEIPLSIVSIENSDESYGSGDINQDGELNVMDIVALVNYVLNTGTLTTEQFYIADMNFDGVINVLDVVTAVQTILGE